MWWRVLSCREHRMDTANHGVGVFGERGMARCEGVAKLEGVLGGFVIPCGELGSGQEVVVVRLLLEACLQ